jgi:CheY-like chemotaxis protein
VPSGNRVLIVEDQYLVADELGRAVNQLGGEVIGPARCVEDALRLAEETRPDLALLDINLDGGSVYPAARKLRRMKIPLIFATGYDREAVIAEFQQTPHIDKPVTAWSLASALSHVLHGGVG